MGTVAPTYEQDPVNFTGIEKQEDLVPTTRGILTSEYVAGGYVGGMDTLLALSHNYDYLSAILTDAEIAKVLRDPEVAKCLTVLKNGAIGDGLTFSPALSEPTPIPPPASGIVETPEERSKRAARDQEIERFKLAKAYADFATRAIDNLETPIRDVLDNLLDALPYGNMVAEKVLKDTEDPAFPGKKLLTLDRIKVKPRRDVVFVVDRFKNLLGFKAWVEVEEDGQKVWRKKTIRKDKFLVLTFGGKEGDPRGTSILVPIYNAWQLKLQVWPEYLRWLIYSAVPPIVGYTSNEASSRKVLRDATTNEILKDADGQVMYESDVGPLLKAIVQIRNASAVALPYGAKVEAINSAVSGDPFKGFIDVLNTEIEGGLINQTLATSDSRHNTRAASQTHVTILDDLVWRIKGLLNDMIEKQLLKPLMELNFADFDISLLPKVSLGDTARRDFATDAAGIAALKTAGFLGESQFVGLDNLLGLPPRNMEADRELANQAAKATAAIASAAAQQQADLKAQAAQQDQNNNPQQGQNGPGGN